MPKTLYTEHDVQDLVAKGTTTLHMDDNLVLTVPAKHAADQLGLHLSYASASVEAAAVWAPTQNPNNAAPNACFDATLVARFGAINSNTIHTKGCFPKKYQVSDSAKGKQNIALIQRMVSALQTHDLDAHDEIWAEDMIWRGPPGFGEIYGREAFKRDVLEGIYYQLFPDFYDDVEIQMAEDDWIAATGFITGTHRGDWFGIAGTGKTVGARYSDFWRVENGRLKENWVMIDQIGLTQQLVQAQPPSYSQSQSLSLSQSLPQSLSQTLSQSHAYSQVQSPSHRSPEAIKNLALVNRMVEHLVNHNLAGQNEVWTEDMVWHGPPGLGDIHTVEGFKRDVVGGTFYKAFPDFFGDIDIELAVGNFVAGTGYVTGTHLGDWFGIPPTGKKIKLRYSDFWRIEGDKLAENWVMIDHIALLQQLGIDPIGGTVHTVGNSTAVESKINQGLINEKHIANLARGTTLLRLGKRAIITALARDKARELGITIEKVT